MCGRFTLTLNPEQIENFISSRFKTHIRGQGIKYPHYNVAPSMDVLTVLKDEAGYRAGYLTWVYMGFNHRDFSVINIRYESMYEKPMFKTSAKSKRCIVLADGYYEWVDGKPKRILRKDGKVFAIAGLWNVSVDSKGKQHKTVGLVTRDAKERFKDVHQRMPVILEDEDIDAWLTGASNEQEIIDHVKPSEYRYYDVSTDVNKVSNNSVNLIDSV